MAYLADKEPTGLTAKTTPVDADVVIIGDSADASEVAKKTTWANIKATLKTYFDTLYAGVLGADDNYVTDAEKVKLSNLSGTNSGDQTSIVGITGTKAQFDTAVTDGNFMYIGDAPTSHTHTLASITDVTSSAAELNVLDGIPGTLTATELGYVDGVTSAIQTQIDAKVTGPASATDNAIARFDSTTGKLIQNSTVTIGDTGAIADTIADTSNVVGLTITQNDVTNNPKAVSITNAGTGNALFIDANGNTGSSASTSGALFLNNTDNVGIGANFYSNAGAGQGVSLVFMKQDNALADKPVLRIDNDGTLNAIAINNNLATSATPAVGIANAGLSNNLSLTKSNTSNTNPVIDITNDAASSVGIQITHTDAANSQGLIKLISPSPEIEFVESDQTTPAGKFEIRGQNNQFTVNSRNSGDSGFENIITINQLQNGGLTKFFGSIETAGGLEVGHATDTTITRVSAGKIAVEGVNVVTTSSTDTLTNKTLTAPTLTGTTVADRFDYDRAIGLVNAIGNLGATETIDWSTHTHYTGTLDSNITFTYSNQVSGQVVTLYLSYDSTAQRTITWPTTTWFDNATGAAPATPAASGKVLVVTLVYIGTTTYGSATGNYAVYA